MRVALTGGIASGKTYVLDRLRERGIATLDADDVVHQLLGPGTPASRDVSEAFGGEFLTADGSADRRRLGRLVFEDAGARRRLEAILHPRVYASIEAWFHRLDGAIGVVSIPLLYETGREGDFDVVVATLCPPAQQIERLARRGLPDADARARIAAQMPAEEKARRADIVIRTGGTLEDTDRQVGALLDELRRRTAAR